MRLRNEMPELDGATKWLNSRPLSKQDVTGKKPVFIYIWSVSCDTCKKTIPKVNELCDFYQGQLNTIAIHMPRTERDKDLAEVRRVAKEHNMSQPIFVDHNATLTNQFNNRYVPAYYLFDTSGKLRFRHSGNGGIQMLQKRVNRILNETEN
ncbi:redoxin domain-containing protein [Lentibacillus salicampi]|uniref:Redoxin domain-containing protein n=1 Tax=Lentibacillus salicampi TaxID=175306 RepID=A0A4Y9AHD6_9BACI|nr:redoxin domain-containing protein [Lentibacillus salicampi]TFJ94497.1 redoxin domain-containing protein [Lentibacillus salicampi]